MTASTVYSANATAIRTSPMSIIDKKSRNGRIIDKIALETTSMDETGDLILMGPVRSNAVLVDLLFMNDALAASGLAYDIGLYYSGIGSGQVALGKVAGDVIDDNCIGTSVAFSSARIVPTSFRFEADDIVNITKELWEVGGLSSDPGGWFYIGLKCAVVATTPAAGDIVMIGSLI